MESSCVCGYKYEADWEKGKTIVVSGDEEFISITGNFFVRSDNWARDERRVDLIACPKCNTIKLNN